LVQRFNHEITIEMNVEERGCEKVDYDNGDKLTGFKY
jgi:hypothetical protein